MRTFLLSLILLNALFWAWNKWIDPSQPQSRTQTEQNSNAAEIPSLKLVSESPDHEVAMPVTELNLADVEPILLPESNSAEVISVDDAPVVAAESEQNQAQSDADKSEAEEPVAAADEPAGDSAVAEKTGEPVASVTDSSASEVALEPLINESVLASVDPVANPARCSSVGPFVNLRKATGAASILNSSGLSTSQRVEEAEVWVGHWVHLPSYPSRAAAIAVVERLRSDGVKDIYIEPSGPLKNSVSLGLFSDIERAEIRAGQIRKLDVKPQITDRRRQGLVYWVDMKLDAGNAVNMETFDSLGNADLRSIDIPCDADNGAFR